MTPRPETLGGIGALASDRVKDPAGRGAAALRAVLDSVRRQSKLASKDFRARPGRRGRSGGRGAGRSRPGTCTHARTWAGLQRAGRECVSPPSPAALPV